MCVCKGNRPGACIIQNYALTGECEGPLGYCEDGVCKPAEREEGCPCDQCEVIPSSEMACQNIDQPCKCGGNGDAGTCVPNFLPSGTACDANVAELVLNECEVAQCSTDGNCEEKSVTDGDACFTETNADLCLSAGTCQTGTCESLTCPARTNYCTENGLTVGDECVLPVSSKTSFDGICCEDKLGFLSCVEQTECECFSFEQPCFVTDLPGLCCADSSTGLTCVTDALTCPPQDNSCTVAGGLCVKNCGNDCGTVCDEAPCADNFPSSSCASCLPGTDDPSCCRNVGNGKNPDCTSLGLKVCCKCDKGKKSKS